MPVRIISHNMAGHKSDQGMCIDISETGVAFVTEADLSLTDVVELVFEAQEVSVGEALKERPDVSILPGISLQHVIVDISTLLPARIEDHLFVGVIGMQCSNHALDRVMEEGRAHSNLVAKAEVVSVVEEWLVLSDRLSLVVEDGPATSDPARVDCCPDLGTRPGLGFGSSFGSRGLGRRNS